MFNVADIEKHIGIVVIVVVGVLNCLEHWYT